MEPASADRRLGAAALPSWEAVVALVALFGTWWFLERLFPGRGFGKFGGMIAAVAVLALIVWTSVLRARRARRRMQDSYQRRIAALKADGIPITHENMYNKAIRPDAPVDSGNGHE